MEIDWNLPTNASVLDQFMAEVGAIHVPTLAYEQGVREFGWLARRARRGEGTCLLVGGDSGSGKSWLLSRNLLANDVAVQVGPYADPLPVISIEAPSPGDTKALAARLLEAVTGYSVSTRESESVLLDRFAKIALKRGVRVIKIDEFQHVVDRFVRADNSKNKNREKVLSENVKTMINTHPFQWILAGEPQVLGFFDSWPQFEGRGRKLPLRPFAWPSDEDAFATFLDKYDDQLTALGFRKKSNLGDMTPRFQLAVQGFHGQAVRRLLKDSAEIAYMAGDPDITGALPVIFERWKRLGDGANPFVMKEKEVRRRLGGAVPLAADDEEALPLPPIRGTGIGPDTRPTFGL